LLFLFFSSQFRLVFLWQMKQTRSCTDGVSVSSPLPEHIKRWLFFTPSVRIFFYNFEVLRVAMRRKTSARLLQERNFSFYLPLRKSGLGCLCSCSYTDICCLVIEVSSFKRTQKSICLPAYLRTQIYPVSETLYSLMFIKMPKGGKRLKTR
jgi:hypothetical protein